MGMLQPSLLPQNQQKKTQPTKSKKIVNQSSSNNEDGSIYNLPKGWRVETKTRNERKKKDDQKKKYRHFLAPSGEIFRSLVSAQRFIQSNQGNTNASSSSSSSSSSEDEESDSDEEEDVHQRYKSGDREGECRKNCTACVNVAAKKK